MKETASEFRERMRNLHGTGRSEISFITMPDGKELWYYKAEEDARLV